MGCCFADEVYGVVVEEDHFCLSNAICRLGDV